MIEYKYKGHRFKQPFRFIFSLIYTIIYPFKHKKLKRSIRIAAKLAFSICMMIELVPSLAVVLIPTPVKADDDEITKEVLKLEKKSWTDPKNLKKQVIIQKSIANNIPIEDVNMKDSVVAVTYPAPVTRPTIDNVAFKAKIVKKEADTDKSLKTTNSNTVSTTAISNANENIDDVSGKKENTLSNQQKMVETSVSSNDVKNDKTLNDTKKDINNDSKDSTVSATDPNQELVTDINTETIADDDEIMPTESANPTLEDNTTDDGSKNTSITDEISNLNLDDKNVNIVENDTSAESSKVEDNIDKTIIKEEQATSQNTDKPTLIIKSDEVTIYKNEIFHPESLIAYIDTSNHTLPVLQTSSNVDTSKDGEYTCTYKVIDQSGNTDTKTIKVNVITHPEQAAEEKKIEEAKKAAEEKAKHEEELKKVRDAGGLFTEERENKETGTSYNPYPGWNYNNCTWAAWQLAHDKQGVNLPHWGNAATWLKKAQNAGYATGSIPRKGAIQVSGGGAGHVSYVANVSADGKMVYIQQGSFYADSRKIPYSGGYSELWQNAYGNLISGKPILGYIYLD